MSSYDLIIFSNKISITIVPWVIYVNIVKAKYLLVRIYRVNEIIKVAKIIKAGNIRVYAFNIPERDDIHFK